VPAALRGERPAERGRERRHRHRGERVVRRDRRQADAVHEEEQVAPHAARILPADGRSRQVRGMKSAYELALERLDAQGIERPREERLSEETKRAIAEARKLTESKLAELDILHRDKMQRLDDPRKREEQEEYYRLEKERLGREGETAVERLRAGGG